MSAETVSTAAIGSLRRFRDGTAPEDARVAELARRQYGVVGREQLRALGLSERAIQHRLTDVVENLLREMEFRQLWDRLSLWDLVERYPGRRGVRKVRVALERLKSDPPGPKRSRLEERLRVLLGVEK